jgi:diguanylate cyclase (GGDEF)-like protein
LKDNQKAAPVPAKAMMVIVAAAFVADVALGVALPALPLAPFALVLMHALLLAAILALTVNAVLKTYRQAEERHAEAPADPGPAAMTDALTRIMNRRAITMSLLDAMAQAQRYGHPLTVGIADIDLFKRVNERDGRDAGDRALTLIAAILSEALRMPDKVGRYGGEEFLVILPHTPLAQGRKIAERMRAAVEAWNFDLNGRPAKLTVSLGVTQYRKGEDLEQLLSRVDKALIQAKTEGRNRVAAHKPVAAPAVTEKL